MAKGTTRKAIELAKMRPYEKKGGIIGKNLAFTAILCIGVKNKQLWVKRQGKRI